jgi:hypothetical protein
MRYVVIPPMAVIASTLGGARLKYIAGIWRHGSGIAAPRVMPSKICL